MKLLSKFILTAGVSAMALSAMPAAAKDLGDTWSKERFQIRARAIGIFADGDGREQVTGLETNVEEAFTPEVDVTYFFTENIAAELIAATAEHEIEAGPNHIGDTWILPPTLTLQYHFTPDNQFSPYVGAGINYSFFYGEDDKNGFADLDVDGGFGYALQAGFDYWLNDNWGVNFDVKYIDLDVDVTSDLSGTDLRADDVELNPWVVGVGAAYRF